jgi:hypothetical protein
MAVTVVDDYVAEAMRLEGILALLTEAQWLTQSGRGALLADRAGWRDHLDLRAG